jgi:tetratricopeptide (TPR) repeat protein
MDIIHSVYRNINGAIKTGEIATANRRALSIEERLFRLYLDNNQVSKAALQLDKIKGAVEIGAYFDYKASILEAEGKYQDAIDTIKSTPGAEHSTKRHATSISYLQLKMGDYTAAAATTKAILEPHAFSLRFEETLINYEYAKIKTKGSCSRARLSELVKSSNNDQAKCVAHLLLGNKNEALAAISLEIQRDFSNADMFLRWPVLSELHEEIMKLKEELFRMRRFFPVIDEAANNIIDIHAEAVELATG